MADRDAHAAMARPYTRRGPGICTRGGSSRSPWSRTSTSTRCCVTSSGIQSGPISWNGQKTGAGRVSVDTPKGMTGVRQLLAAWPIPRPEDRASRVNRAESKKELEALRRGVQRGQPYGSEPWCQRIVQPSAWNPPYPPRPSPKNASEALKPSREGAPGRLDQSFGFPLPPLKFRTAGFPQYGFKWTVNSDLRRHPEA